MRKVIIILLFFTSCINPYDYRQDSSTGSLVVEGYVSNNPGDSEIKLSWSGVFQRTNFEELTSAEVVVIEDETIEYSFAHQKDGIYIPVREDFAAKMESSYRLKIVVEEQVYESDKVTMLSSLEIDSVSYRFVELDQNGDELDEPSLRLFLTSNSDESASRYYIYSFEETWRVLAGYSRDIVIKPIFIFDKNDNPININFETTYEGNTTYCWPYNKVEGINVVTTEGLERNQIIDVPIFGVNLRSTRLLFRYSVLVNQYAVNQEVHHFLNMLKEFSENSGFLYDIQPGYIQGNMHNTTTPGDNVIGMFYASSHKSTRIFISKQELSPRAKSIVYSYQPTCDAVSIGHPPDFEAPVLPITKIPNDTLTEGLQYVLDSLMNKMGLSIYNYFELEDNDTTYLILQMANRHCIDCRVYGTNIEPLWWEENY